MALPLSFFPFWLFLLVSTPVQLYLFRAARDYLHRRVATAGLRRVLIYGAAGVIGLMFLPMAWRAYGGIYGEWRYPSGVLEIITVSLIWWLGSAGCAVVLLAGRWLQHRRLVRPGSVPVNPARRLFLGKTVGFAAAAPFAVSGYGVLLEPRRSEIEYFTVGIADVPPELASVTIVQLTDIHVGPFMTGRQLAYYVAQANALQPDFIVLTGDFVASAPEEALPCADALARLRARHGIFACPGNHDIAAGVAEKLAMLFADRGIRMLVNDAATVPVGASRVAFLGIDDLAEGRPDLPRALALVNDKKIALKILLSHRPEIFPAAAREGIDVVISGHYHGGQIKLLPQRDGLSVARFLTTFPEGLYRRPDAGARSGKESSLFVGRGLGVSGLPIRINCPPQIAHLTLTNSAVPVSRRELS